MRFVGKVWKLLVGIKDGLVLLFMLLFFGLLYAAMSSRPTIGAGEKGALVLDVSGPIVEQPAQASPSEVLSGTAGSREYRLRDIVHGLRQAAGDDRVQTVVLDLDIFAGGGQATLVQAAEALDAVKKAGKPVLAYATAYDDDSYLLASHASEIWLNPMGGVMVRGPGGNNLYFKDLMDRLGITANVYRVGTYKAAVEPFTRADMSPEARENAQALYGAMWESWQQSVRQARPKAQIAAYVADSGGRIQAAGGDMAKAALAAGLVDHVGDRQAFGARVAKITGTLTADVPGSYRKIGFDKWAATYPATEEAGEIGIVTVAGNIVDGEANAGTAGAETIVKALERGMRDRNLKAIVLRVDSPGGSALASERIRQALIAAKAKGLPVVVSMGSLAASGGYWVAMAGDKIYAEPSTITGSIGVFGILPSFEGALAKLGVGADGVKTTPLSGEPDLLHGPAPEADRLLQMGVENTYRRFLALVSDRRKLPVARVDQIAQGRVWDGGTARQLGLVDAFGGLDDAVAEAARMAKIDADDAKPVWLEQEPDFFDSMLLAFASGGEEEEQASPDAFGRMGMLQRRMMTRAAADAELLMTGASVQARCLSCPTTGAVARPRPGGFAAMLLKLIGA
ncbi:signal peptide peptidase SppA [Allosphingosinicella deserti]|uniref:Signal peptide peptidase SppA n=1 Tax=Allosphingosinicella deserti TaxID=2116704 RepID=A0A2P7QG52_9SPHN|nr:signal peptide peptidase SppA [Sphingomonas deserti]PSJ36906.1 signal peptide peptidase SppA [Sphingomonas deserti]